MKISENAKNRLFCKIGTSRNFRQKNEKNHPTSGFQRDILTFWVFFLKKNRFNCLFFHILEKNTCFTVGLSGKDPIMSLIFGRKKNFFFDYGINNRENAIFGDFFSKKSSFFDKKGAQKSKKSTIFFQIFEKNEKKKF